MICPLLGGATVQLRGHELSLNPDCIRKVLRTPRRATTEAAEATARAADTLLVRCALAGQSTEEHCHPLYGPMALLPCEGRRWRGNHGCNQAGEDGDSCVAIPIHAKAPPNNAPIAILSSE